MLFSLLCQQALKRKGRPSGLIGQYKPYLNSNDSPTRDVLKDYSGNGHDIQLYNFAFAESSGYGKYANDFSKFTKHPSNKDSVIYTGSKIEVVNNMSNSFLTLTYSNSVAINPMKVRISGINRFNVYYKYINQENTYETITIKDNGIYDLPESYISDSIKEIGFQVLYNSDKNYVGLTIEQIPDYKGALVSDGVDDYGACKNFPIFTKEKGYTVVALRKWLDTNKSGLALASNINALNEAGAFLLENKGIAVTSFNVRNFGSTTNIQEYFNNNNIFVYLSSSKYNGKVISKGSKQGEPTLSIFKYYTNVNKYYANAALYALEIYDRDLTDEEIEKVKEAMYEEYLTATNALQNHIIADYECYDKSNEDEDRDVLKDLSGNGHDITLHNFAWSGMSGIGGYYFSTLHAEINANTNYELSSDRSKITVLSNKVQTNAIYTFTNYIEIGKSYHYKIRVTGLDEINKTYPNTLIANSNSSALNITEDGDYEIEGVSNCIFVTCTIIFQTTIPVNTPINITIEQIPLYPNALVSDGVDDYGLCENFPELPIEKGFTVLAIRKWINKSPTVNAVFLNTRNTVNDKVVWGPLNFEKILVNNQQVIIGVSVYSYSRKNDFDLSLIDSLFTYMTSTSYNGNSIIKGTDEDQLGKLGLFSDVLSSNVEFSSIALYALKIFDRDLTDEEIEYEKKKMIRRYEEKTGEKFEELN